MPANKKTIQAPCNDCGRKTDHKILKTHKTGSSDPEDGTWWETEFSMIECCGCHFISLKRRFEFSEHGGPEIEYFPPPISRRKPHWYDDLVMNIPVDLELSELLTEVYSALHANNRRLATMGARTLLDMAMVNIIGDVGGFGKKAQALETKGLIGKQQREFLEAALDAGSAAAHRGHCPTAEQLNHVMDIVESILHQIYVLPNAAKELKKSTPPRKKTTP